MRPPTSLNAFTEMGFTVLLAGAAAFGQVFETARLQAVIYFGLVDPGAEELKNFTELGLSAGQQILISNFIIAFRVLSAEFTPGAQMFGPHLRVMFGKFREAAKFTLGPFLRDPQIMNQPDTAPSRMT